MDEDKEKEQPFDCSVLGGIAHIQIREKYTSVNQIPQPTFQGVDFIDCADALRCGITTRRGDAFYTDWSLCPAHRLYNS